MSTLQNNSKISYLPDASNMLAINHGDLDLINRQTLEVDRTIKMNSSVNARTVKSFPDAKSFLVKDTKSKIWIVMRNNDERWSIKYSNLLPLLLSPDGNLYPATSFHDILTMHRLSDKKVVFTDEHILQNETNGIMFSADSSRLIVHNYYLPFEEGKSAKDNNLGVFVYNTLTGTLEFSIPDATGNIILDVLALSDDRLLTCNSDNKIYYYSLKSGQSLLASNRLLEGSCRLHAMDGGFIESNDSDLALNYISSEGYVNAKILGQGCKIIDVEVSPESGEIAVSCEFGYAHLLNMGINGLLSPVNDDRCKNLTDCDQSQQFCNFAILQYMNAWILIIVRMKIYVLVTAFAKSQVVNAIVRLGLKACIVRIVSKAITLRLIACQISAVDICRMIQNMTSFRLNLKFMI